MTSRSSRRFASRKIDGDEIRLPFAAIVADIQQEYRLIRIEKAQKIHQIFCGAGGQQRAPL